MAIGAASCGSSSTTVSTPNGSATINASGNGSNASVKIQTNKGTAEIDAGTKVPAGFPSAVPLPTFLRLSSSLGTRTGTTSGYDLIYSVSSSVPEALARYDADLRAAGFSSSASATINGIVEQVWHSAAWTVQVQAATASAAGSSGTLDLVIVPTPPAS
jgi:hypothetical protein